MAQILVYFFKWYLRRDKKEDDEGEGDATGLEREISPEERLGGGLETSHDELDGDEKTALDTRDT